MRKPSINFSTIYTGSFDLYKVFDNLVIKDISEHMEGVPKTFWQILNHLVSWQAYQLKHLNLAGKEINEAESWVDDKIPGSQWKLDELVEIFKRQIEAVKKEINQLSIEDTHIQHKLKVIQEVATHLSFHLGELILMQRMLGKYPLPHQMKEFLSA